MMTILRSIGDEARRRIINGNFIMQRAGFSSTTSRSASAESAKGSGGGSGRLKRSKLIPAIQNRLGVQLSVLSARRKLPQRLKLSIEDLIRHRTIARAWALKKRQDRKERMVQLQRQFYQMEQAAEDLKQHHPYLFEQARRQIATFTHEKTKQLEGQPIRNPESIRFPPELRPPTETPRDIPWNNDWKGSETLPRRSS